MKLRFSFAIIIIVILISTSLSILAYIQNLNKKIQYYQTDAYQKALNNFYMHEEIFDFEITKDDILLGNKEAKVKIFIFSDPICPACVDFYKTEKLLQEKYQSKIAFIHYFFPLESTCNKAVEETHFIGSCAITEIFLEAHRYGVFQEIFNHYSKLTQKYNPETKYPKIIKLLKINLSKLKKNPQTNKSSVDLLNSSINKSKSARIEGTPTIFINTRKYYGLNTVEDISHIIDIEFLQCEDCKK